MSEEDKEVDWSAAVASGLKKKIEEQEKESKEIIRIMNDNTLKQDEKIEALENIVQKMGVKVDFTSQESGQALKEIAELSEWTTNNREDLVEQLTELKERNVHYHHWVQSKLDEYDNRILISEINREVLRELLNGFERYYRKKISYMDLRVIIVELLEKFDSQGKTDKDKYPEMYDALKKLEGKTEKKEEYRKPEKQRCKKCGMVFGVFGLSGKCPQCNSEIEASGGEKSVNESQKSIDSSKGSKKALDSTDSKPPEPDCESCKYFISHQENCTTCAYYPNQDSIKIYVKREKIEFWRLELLNKTDEVLKSMREVLGIE